MESSQSSCEGEDEDQRFSCPGFHFKSDYSVDEMHIHWPSKRQTLKSAAVSLGRHLENGSGFMHYFCGDELRGFLSRLESSSAQIYLSTGLVA